MSQSSHTSPLLQNSLADAQQHYKMQLLKAFVTSLLITSAVAANVQGADKRQMTECDQNCRAGVRNIQRNLPS